MLIVGGTLFLGRRLVEAALARGHQVTTFTRGRHNPGIHTDVEALRGDRNSDVSALNGRRWDAMIDTCGYVPVGVTRVIDAIGRERLPHYTFISSVSAYAEHPRTGGDEYTPLATIDRGPVEGSGRDGDRRTCNGPHVRGIVRRTESRVRAGGRANGCPAECCTSDPVSLSVRTTTAIGSPIG